MWGVLRDLFRPQGGSMDMLKWGNMLGELEQFGVIAWGTTEGGALLPLTPLY